MTEETTKRAYRKCTAKEWFAEGEALYGTDRMQWKFQCPLCGHVTAGQDWIDAGGTEGNIGFSCIGRLLPNCRDAFSDAKTPGPCNYTGGGLFRLNPVIITHEGEEHHYFEFADHKEAEPAGDPESIHSDIAEGAVA